MAGYHQTPESFLNFGNPNSEAHDRFLFFSISLYSLEFEIRYTKNLRKFGGEMKKGVRYRTKELWKLEFKA